MTWRVIHADCIEAMADMDEASVDAVVTDPPYGLEFMGKEWDRLWNRHEDDETRSDGRTARKFQTPTPQFVGGSTAQVWHQAWATEALRVLKPGGHLLAFGGTRTYHRLTCALEDAGFEIRDCLAWLYGSGFPKSLDVSKAIDKAAGAEREIVGRIDRRGWTSRGIDERDRRNEPSHVSASNSEQPGHHRTRYPRRRTLARLGHGAQTRLRADRPSP